MKSFKRIIVLGMALTLIAGNFALAQDTTEVKTYTISGTVGPGLGGVEMKGFPGKVITDGNGYYVTEVKSGWAGRVAPAKAAYSFRPASMIYTKVNEDRDNQNFIAERITLTISGSVGIPGVVMNGLPHNPVTGNDGAYSAIVDFGWAGKVRPHKEGFTFSPPFQIYSAVSRDMTNENYRPEQQTPDMYGTRSGRRVAATYPSAYGQTGGRRVLVVPAADIKPEELSETVEDMYIFSNILDEGFKEPRMIQGVFRDFGDFFGRDNRQTEAVYMQGYGVVFMMEVDYTFTPVPQTEEKSEDTAAEEVDSTWLRARERIFSPGGGGRMSRPDSARDNGRQMVEELKAELVRTLRHATNIRNIAPDEWVILSVTGTGRQSGSMMMGGWRMYGGSSTRSEMSSSGRIGGSGGGMGSSGGGMMGGMGGGSGGGMGAGGGMMGGTGGGFGGAMGGGMYGGMGGYVEMDPGPATVLTIRAKKSDVDAFAKSETDFEQFRQKVQFLMY